MPNKPRHMRAGRDRELDKLRKISEERELEPIDIEQAARACGYSPRQIRRCLASSPGEPIEGTNKFVITELIITIVFLYCGVLAKAHRALEKRGVAVPSLSTFKRYVVREMGTAQLSYARKGTRGFREASVYLQGDNSHRMHTVELDHTELPILVVPRGHKRAVKPWITGVMDRGSRYLLSWVITMGVPTAEEIRASLIQAITLRCAPDGETVVGGKPLIAKWDRGKDFLSNLSTESCMRLEIVPIALPAYSPHLKGRLERFWRTLKEDLLVDLPGYLDGPRDLRGNTALESHALGEDEFVLRLDTWIDDYLTDHVISTTGMTPLQMWRNDPTPLDEVPAEQLWQDMLLSKDRCKVSKNGIRWDGIDWYAGELIKVKGLHVEIRYLPHDRTFIEVFRDGHHICTAVPQGSPNPEEEHKLLVQRAEARKQAQQRFTQANRLRKTGHDELHRLDIDKNGNRIVRDPAEELLSGEDEALKKFLDKPDGKADDDGPDRLF